MIDPAKIKKDFPILSQTKDGKPLIYLDNASTTQKPKQVIAALTNFYETTNANIHRGIYDISEKATLLYDKSRETTQKFINAASKSEIIFTRNTTEAINLVAYTWGEKNIQKGDEIIISIAEHHSNFLPWQSLANKKGAHLKFIPIKDDLTLDLDEYKKLLSPRTKLVAVSSMSNVLGTINPIKEITKLAKEHGAHVLIDAAQTAAHSPINVQEINCDFLAFSSHKMFGPTGVGILYARQELLKKMPPFLYGGDMIASVELESAEFAKPPHKFEAGTGNIADVVAFKAALDYITDLGLENIQDHEKELYKYAIEKLSAIPGIKLITPPEDQSGPVITFTIKGIHPHDIAAALNEENIAIRAGKHCTDPLHKHLQVIATSRISLSIYNDKSDIDKAVEALKNCIKLFA